MRSSSACMRAGSHCLCVGSPRMMVRVASATTSCAGTVLHHRSIEAAPFEFDLQDGDALGALHRLGLQQQRLVVGKAAVGREAGGDPGQYAETRQRSGQSAGPCYRRKTHATLPWDGRRRLITPVRTRRQFRRPDPAIRFSRIAAAIREARQSLAPKRNGRRLVMSRRPPKRADEEGLLQVRQRQVGRQLDHEGLAAPVGARRRERD